MTVQRSKSALKHQRLISKVGGLPGIAMLAGMLLALTVLWTLRIEKSPTAFADEALWWFVVRAVGLAVVICTLPLLIFLGATSRGHCAAGLLCGGGALVFWSWSAAYVSEWANRRFDDRVPAWTEVVVEHKRSDIDPRASKSLDAYAWASKKLQHRLIASSAMGDDIIIDATPADFHSVGVGERLEVAIYSGYLGHCWSGSWRLVER